MSQKITSRIHNYGDPCESEWPSRFGTGEKGIFHFNHNKGETVGGVPENPNNHFETPPMAIFDTIRGQYHPDVGRVLDSRSEWQRADAAHGRITFGSTEEVRRTTTERVRQEQREMAEDRRNAAIEAHTEYRQNPTEVKQRREKMAEQQMTTLKESGLGKKLKEAGITYE